MMKVKISNKLRFKLVEQIDSLYNKTSPYNFSFIVEFDEDETDILNECQKWYNEIKRFFSTSYMSIKTDVGPFKGLWPSHIEKKFNKNFVEFEVDFFKACDINWTNWFIVKDDIKDPPQFIQEEI